MIEIFLGGTCNNSNWRDILIPMLKVNFFNPIVDDWNEEAQQLEIDKRQSCDIILYVITPKMKGVYSIAEIIDDSNKRPLKTIFCVLTNDDDLEFEEFQIKSLEQVKNMAKTNGAIILNSLEEIAEYVNNQTKLVEAIDIWKKYNKI